MKINNKKLSCSALVLIMLLLSFSVSTMAGTSKKIVLTIGNPYMYVDNIKKEIDSGNNTYPVIKDGRTLLPIRAIAEEIGAKVEWDSKQRLVTVEDSYTTIKLWIDKKNVRVNGFDREIDVAPTIINGRTMLPLRFVTETLDCEINWDAEKKEITIVKEDNKVSSPNIVIPNDTKTDSSVIKENSKVNIPIPYKVGDTYEDKNNVSYAENVILLENINPKIEIYLEQLSYTKDYDMQIVFKNDAPKSLTSLKVGDVFVIKPTKENPTTFIAKVSEVNQTDGKTTMILIRPKLKEIFKD